MAFPKVDMEHSYTNKQMQKLAAFPVVDQIENYGMDDGRFFVHLIKGYRWNLGDGHTTESFGSIKDARYALKHSVIPCSCADCTRKINN